MRRDRLAEALAAGLVALVVFAVFGPALSNGFVEWDDPYNLTNNPHYRGFSPAHLRWMLTTRTWPWRGRARRCAEGAARSEAPF